MTIPFVIDNAEHRLADALNELLAKSEGKPLDIATAYFAISGYRLVQEGLRGLGAFRLLIGSDPKTGADVGLRPSPPAPLPVGEGSKKAQKKRLRGDVQAEPFTPATLRLVEDLIGFLREERVEVRLYDRGFLHAKAYLFH
jgi:hypothetical protein